MASNAQALCTSFKKELLCGSHAFGAQAANGTRTVTTADTFKMALFTVNSSIGAATTAYSSTGELSASGGYSAGGNAITNATAPTTSGTTAYWTPSASVTWTSFTSSGAFDCALIWNTASTGSLAVGSFTFGSQSVSAGTFSLVMPVNASGTALVQLT